jgi:hypothetical protein
MRLNKWALAAIAFLALSTAVVSQVITVPQVSTLNQTDLIQVIPNGSPSAGNQYAPVPRITNVTGFYKGGANTSTPGFTYAFGTDVTIASFVPGSTTTYAYITLATNPSDGSSNCIFSKSAITFTYICTASTGKGNCTSTAVNDGITTLAANTRACYQWSKATAAWDRTQ